MKFTTLALLLAVVATEDEIPGSAQDDIQKDAATKAAEDIATYDAGRDADLLAELKKDAAWKAKYDAADAAGKTALDAENDAIVKQRKEAREARDSAEKTAAGYASMTAEQKTIFDDQLLKWKKAKADACKASSEAEACTGADAARKAQEEKRNTDGYYKKSLSAREADDKVRTEAEAKKKAETQAAEEDEKKKEEEKAAEDKAKAAAEAAKPKAGEANFRCEKSGDTRPTCNEGLCCGAAQKFLRDGTKLAVETCQSATGVHVYTYYPPLPLGATAEPTPETWRFQCISGAQKLFAAATAALAASAMMA